MAFFATSRTSSIFRHRHEQNFQLQILRQSLRIRGRRPLKIEITALVHEKRFHEGRRSRNCVGEAVFLGDRNCVGEPVGRPADDLICPLSNVARIYVACHGYRRLAQPRQFVDEGDADANGIQFYNSLEDFV